MAKIFLFALACFATAVVATDSVTDAVTDTAAAPKDWSWEVCSEGDTVYIARPSIVAAGGAPMLQCQPFSVNIETFSSDDNVTVATALLGRQANETGWHVLSIKTRARWGNGEEISMEEQGFAAGFLEASVSANGIASLGDTMKKSLFAYRVLGPSQAILTFFDEHIAFVKNLSRSGHYEESYSRELRFVLSQLEGMAAALKGTRADEWSDLKKLFLLNSVGDLEELLFKFHRGVAPDFDKMTPDEVELALALRGHCSAAIKLTMNSSEVLAGHSTWFTYGFTNRIFKHYQFGDRTHISFSSYPGIVSSLDDYYQLHHSDIVMLQTTNGIHNDSLYELITPQSLLSWQRVRIANAVATGGKSWFDAVAKYNSGTYNNQYMIIDFKLFTKGKGFAADGVWVIEQCPGLSDGMDISPDIMREGYYASYNIPFFKSIADASGWTRFAERHGSDYIYQTAPRGQLFRQYQPSVHNFEDFKSLLRHNDYQHDEISRKNPWRAICSRGDLFPVPVPAGCLDTKATTSEMFRKGKTSAINGPTTGGGFARSKLPPFRWSLFKDWMPHAAFPQVFDFDFVEIVSPFSQQE